ncbi:isoprenylcysteine carboxyl methyltransferase family protein [Telmatospirillum sp. J64-1]|uniref:isoprenylcysteine carboxyl methyltransferase family protein n=1 Tax=Telmatospirillum sp. J64-1 TaxID=2502183 RepID=UPI00115D4243|nr:isoprenylcysteine carboxylmethyltransferase family protein [Telmatospirillum sp. J64-1]
MSLLYVILALVVVQRLGELVLARRNTNRLLSRGGQEFGAGHYPLFVLLHSLWLLSMALLIPPQAPANPFLLVLFALLMAARLWVISSLGPYWTTRIITVHNEPLVRRGPYRLMRHPNYAVVVGEIAVLPLAFGAWQIALVFSLLNGALLAWRIHVENQVLAVRRNHVRI